MTLGKISGLFGVEGMVKVFSYTGQRGGILDYPRWWLGKQRREVAVLEGRSQGKTIVARLEGVTDREEARALIGQEVAVPLEMLPLPAPGEFYWADLVGLAVVNRQGQHLGTVTGFLETGAHDVLVTRDGALERLIPYADGVVVGVDKAAGRIEVDWQADW